MKGVGMELGRMTPHRQYRACVDGLRTFSERIGARDAVLGLSGGIDSSLVACMCADVFGASHVHGFMMPGPYSSGHSLIDARALAANLGIRAEVISIVEAYEAFARVLAPHCVEDASGQDSVAAAKGAAAGQRAAATDDVATGRCAQASSAEFAGLASENTQARCRMVVLMALANAHGWMMVNCGNKSEAMMGYSTLYGDTAGAYAPIGGLYKTDVFAVARWVNERAAERGAVPPIPENVLVKPPSAELAPDQFDEDTLGSYAELDRMLIDHVERGMDADALIAAGYDATEAKRVTERVASYAFKRALCPPFPPIAYA